jgi:hypothetical protein
MLTAHVVGCIWWALGVSSFNADDGSSPPGSAWVIRSKLLGVPKCNETIHGRNPYPRGDSNPRRADETSGVMLTSSCDRTPRRGQGRGVGGAMHRVPTSRLTR